MDKGLEREYIVIGKLNLKLRMVKTKNSQIHNIIF